MTLSRSLGVSHLFEMRGAAELLLGRDGDTGILSLPLSEKRWNTSSPCHHPMTQNIKTHKKLWPHRLLPGWPDIFSVQFRAVAQSCLTLCNPMNHSTLGLPVHHQLQKFTQTHIHRVSDAIQPSHPLSSPSPPALNLSQHQGLFYESALRIRWPKY